MMSTAQRIAPPKRGQISRSEPTEPDPKTAVPPLGAQICWYFRFR